MCIQSGNLLIFSKHDRPLCFVLMNACIESLVSHESTVMDEVHDSDRDRKFCTNSHNRYSFVFVIVCALERVLLLFNEISDRFLQIFVLLIEVIYSIITNNRVSLYTNYCVLCSSL